MSPCSATGSSESELPARICLLFAAILFCAKVVWAEEFLDPLDVPASPVSRPAAAHLVSVANAGERLIAVGLRGLIAASEDQGRTWVQIPAPVSSDLVAVQFPDPLNGWAVGHDGVVLHTEDGGRNWRKQYDGRVAAEDLIKHFRLLAGSGNENAERLLPEIELNYAKGPEQALLGVWFEDRNHGYVVGSFGTLLATSDGGRTWQSWIERADVDFLAHYNAITGIGKDVYIASEQGVVLKLDRAQQRFVALDTGYQGSFFALAGEGDTVIAFGLRGRAYRSTDAGARWVALDTSASGSFSDAASLGNGKVIAVMRNGRAILTKDLGNSFEDLPVARPMLFMGAAKVGNRAVIIGSSGVTEASVQ